MTASKFSKSMMLNAYHARMRQVLPAIITSGKSREEKAREVNAHVNAIRAELDGYLEVLPKAQRQHAGLVLQYCYSVASLEYRHRVWPYEYMAFSRRVGELWEAFCSAAWNHPSRASVYRIRAPAFGDVRSTLQDRITANIGDAHQNRQILLTDITLLFEMVGDVNMCEDEVFELDGIPHVVDFKSGFGSNEKGNMLRLQAVGRAYKLWNHETVLLLLVRQNENNNYLRVLRRAGLWAVHTGDSAYDEMSRLTGADVQNVRHTVIDWQSDLSKGLYDYLRSQPTDLTGYLRW